MKNFRNVIILLTMLSTSCFSQIIDLKYFTKKKQEVKEIVFVNPSSNANETSKTFGDNLSAILKKQWKLAIPYKILEEEEARKYGKDNPAVLLGEFVEVTVVGGSSTNEFRLMNSAKRWVIKVFLNRNLLDQDIAYGINVAQFMFENSAKFKNKMVMEESPKLYGEALENKTLLVAKNLVNKKLTSKEVKEAYPYKYKQASPEEIATAIMERDANVVVAYAFHQLAEQGYALMSWMIYQPSDGAIVSYATYRPIVMRQDMTKKDLQAIVKNAK